MFKAPMCVHYHVQAGERELAANCGADIARTPVTSARFTAPLPRQQYGHTALGQKNIMRRDFEPVQEGSSLLPTCAASMSGPRCRRCGER
jgi:hypothetical protein